MSYKGRATVNANLRSAEMRITVIGSGYVGLVVGACLADSGNEVVCADVDERKVEKLWKGEVPFFEPGLDDIVLRNVQQRRLRFTTDVERAIRDGGVIFIAVGTPQGDDGSAEMRYVDAVADTIGQALGGGENVLIDGLKIVLTKSTVPVGTSDRIREIIGRNAKQPFVVCSNPEFLKEGDAVNDFLKPDRIVIGTPETPEGTVARRALHELFEPFNRTHDRMLFMDVRSSELTKYAANALLATKITFMNDLANLAERVGADIERVRVGIGSDPRIGYQFLFPGTGYGGSCFPKDVKALLHTSEVSGHPLRLLAAVDAVNKDQKRILLRKIIAHYATEDLTGKTFAVWGLAFKPRTDDMRDAPSIDLITGLLAAGAKVRAYDPEAAANARYYFEDRITYCDGKDACLEGSDALVIVTEWSAFRSPDFDLIHRTLKAPVIVDGRNLYEPERVAARGFTYYAIGRGVALPV
jgi:UDPglucose 6-dehydrogenase